MTGRCPHCGSFVDSKANKQLVIAGVELRDHHLRFGDKKIYLPLTELQVMELFFQSFDRTVTSKYLYDFLYGHKEVADQPISNPLKMLIFKLRKKLADMPLDIVTIRSVGWQLVKAKS